jgi:hypothetical protein
MEYFNNKVYSYELLHKQISEDENLSVDKIQQIKEKHLQCKGYVIDLRTILNILSTVQNNEKVIESLIINDNIFDNKILYNFISIFNTIYKRDINVLEFIKYYPKLCIGMSGLKGDELDKALNDEYKIHINKYGIVKTLYKNYLSKNLDEKIFIEKYNKIIEKGNFEIEIINELIEKPEYFDCLKIRITDLYKENYSKKISDFDLNYCFEVFKNKKYNINEDLISPEIIAITDLTKKYSEELLQIFNKFLIRNPDVREYQKYITKYRRDDDFVETNKYIENEILNSLEYQMVLKDKIITKYKEMYNEEILPSIIYMILTEIIENNNKCKTDTKELELLIETVKNKIEKEN